MKEQSVISVAGLKKMYGLNTGVDDISFQVAKGEVFGLLGPNGAGKTTTLECMEGIRKPDRGTITVAGCNPLRGNEIRQKLGVQLQSSSLPDTICVGEIMEIICAWHGVAARTDLLERFGLGGVVKKQVHALSTGQKRRLHLALALANDPVAVILDEPTAGLDVEGRTSLHRAIRDLKASGITVLLATHDMAEAEALCDRIAILIKGKISVMGTPAQVTAAGNTRSRITIRTANGCLLHSAEGDKTEDGYIQFSTVDSASSVMELLQRVKSAGDTVEDLRIERPSLEERFMEIVKGEKEHEGIL